MPPPVTPSPHRFRPPRDSGSCRTRPPSSLRREAPPPSPQTPGPVATRNHVPASQFKPTPRFSAPARPSGHGADVTSTQLRNGPSASQQFAPRFNRTDSIEDSSPQEDGPEEHGDQDDEMLFDSESQAVVQSVEPRFASTGTAHDQGNTHGRPFRSDADFVDEKPSKRRRLSSHLVETAQTSSTGQMTPRPRPPRHRDLRDNPDPNPMNPPATCPKPTSPPRTSRPSRFKPSTTASERGHSTEPIPPPSTTNTTTSSRPRNPFRLPPTSRQAAATGADDAAATPLPEAFSPHRRNQKFVPGGMAETVRGWILGVGHGHGNAAARRALASKFVVTASADADGENANRWRLLAGTAADGADGPGVGREVRALLVEQGQGQRGGQRASVGEGDEVSVGAPSWDVEVASGIGGDGETQRWVVGVDWRRVNE